MPKLPTIHQLANHGSMACQKWQEGKKSAHQKWTFLHENRKIPVVKFTSALCCSMCTSIIVDMYCHFYWRIFFFTPRIVISVDAHFSSPRVFFLTSAYFFHIRLLMQISSYLISYKYHSLDIAEAWWPVCMWIKPPSNGTGPSCTYGSSYDSIYLCPMLFNVNKYYCWCVFSFLLMCNFSFKAYLFLGSAFLFWVRIFVSGPAFLFLALRIFFQWRVFFDRTSWLGWTLLRASRRSDRH